MAEQYRLFMDDVRDPGFRMTYCSFQERQAENERWVVAKTVDVAMQVIMDRGCPIEMDLDHDMGHGPDGTYFIKWLIQYDQENNIIPENFVFDVHSFDGGRRKWMYETLKEYVDLKFNRIEGRSISDFNIDDDEGRSERAQRVIMSWGNNNTTLKVETKVPGNTHNSTGEVRRKNKKKKGGRRR